MHLLTEYLRKTNVAFTKRHLKSLLEQYPHRGSLWSYHKILNEYGVPNTSYRVRDKGLIGKIHTPFFAEVRKGIVVVCEVTDEAVHYKSFHKHESKPLSDFSDNWTGVVLEGIPNEYSQEEKYEEHLKEERKEKAALVLFCLCIGCAIVFASCAAKPYQQWNVWHGLAFATNLAGLFLCLLLMGKKLELHSHVADVLCGILQGGQCEKSSFTGKVRAFGMFGLDECGTGYFLANCMALLFGAGTFANALAYMAICALPVVVWSISYQRKKGQWCVLCLLTMAVLLVQVAVYCAGGFILGINAFLKSSLVSFSILALAYYSLVFLVRKGVTLFGKWKGLMQEKEAFLRMKNDKTVFLAKLHSQKRLLENGEALFSLNFGENDEEKPVVTVVGNPFCNPCALMHRRLGKLLQMGFHIRYVFTFFEESLSFINKEILASFFKNEAEVFWTLLSEWYENGRHAEGHFDPQLTEADLQGKRVALFFEKQKEWIERNGVKATPLVLIEGYHMPAEYEIEDLFHIY